MKTKLLALLTGLTTVTTLVAATVPVQANEIDDLMKAFFEFAPTQDRMRIQADGVNIKEFALTGPLTVNYDIANLEAVFLGEVAAYQNTVSLGGQDLWSNIRTVNELFDYQAPNNPNTGLPPRLGTFNSQLNGTAGFLDIGSTVSLGSFKVGDSLDFAVSNPDFNFSMSSAPGQFMGYTLAGFDDWLIIGIEDTMGKFSDWDFNDAVFAVRLGSPGASVPEPSTIAALIGVTAAFGVSRRKNANKS